MVDKDELTNRYCIGNINAKNIGTTPIEIDVYGVAFELEKAGFSDKDIYKALDNLEDGNYVATFEPPTEYNHNSYTVLQIDELEYTFHWKNMW